MQYTEWLSDHIQYYVSKARFFQDNGDYTVNLRHKQRNIQCWNIL